ncbi:MAG: hypothetical protein LBV80_00450 [Deltaproteobacteria bacterium]|jgi:hypothetical protein|nr:hypothetical protein [Deltaproteobacteria bacterium]
MTFTAMAPLFERCQRQLDKLARNRDTGANRFSVCARGLSEILTSLDDYDKNVVIAHKFADSLAANAEAITQEMIFHEGEPTDEAMGHLYELAFQMVEDLAVIVREKTMRSAVEVPSPGELDVMDYFERRGFWFLGDDTLVTEYYYTGLPIALIPQIFVNR